jgi:hypothetical protein
MASWAFAIVPFAFGVFLAILMSGDRRRARLVARTPTSRIADATDGLRVEIKGEALADLEGTVRVPGVKSDALYYEVAIEREAATLKGTKEWHPLATRTGGMPFLVTDGSARRARIVPEGASITLDPKTERTVELRPFYLPPDVRALLPEGDVAGSPHAAALTWTGLLRARVRTIVPGSPVYALGFGALETQGVTTGPYRGDPEQVLVLRHDGYGRELIVTTLSEATLLVSLRLATNAGFVLMAVGVAVGIWLAFGR